MQYGSYVQVIVDFLLNIFKKTRSSGQSYMCSIIILCAFIFSSCTILFRTPLFTTKDVFPLASSVSNSGSDDGIRNHPIKATRTDSYLENGRLRILVYGYDGLRVFHACQMLDGTADANSDV